MGLYILKSLAKARFQFGNVIHDFRSEEIRLNIEYFFNPKSLVDGILPMGRNCFTCLKIGHQTKDCPIANSNRKERNNGRRIYSESFDDNPPAIICYRCRKSGHMARDCQDSNNNDKRQKQQQVSNNNISSGVNNSNKNTNNSGNQKVQVSHFPNNERCFTCSSYGHLSRDCKNTVIFSSKSSSQQQQYNNRQPIGLSHSLNHQQQSQQSAPIPKIIRIDHVPQTRRPIKPPILIQSGMIYFLPL